MPSVSLQGCLLQGHGRSRVGLYVGIGSKQAGFSKTYLPSWCVLGVYVRGLSLLPLASSVRASHVVIDVIPYALGIK